MLDGVLFPPLTGDCYDSYTGRRSNTRVENTAFSIGCVSVDALMDINYTLLYIIIPFIRFIS